MVSQGSGLGSSPVGEAIERALEPFRGFRKLAEESLRDLRTNFIAARANGRTERGNNVFGLRAKLRRAFCPAFSRQCAPACRATRHGPRPQRACAHRPIGSERSRQSEWRGASRLWPRSCGVRSAAPSRELWRRHARYRNGSAAELQAIVTRSRHLHSTLAADFAAVIARKNAAAIALNGFARVPIGEAQIERGATIDAALSGLSSAEAVHNPWNRIEKLGGQDFEARNAAQNPIIVDEVWSRERSVAGAGLNAGSALFSWRPASRHLYCS